ncbi:MAG: flavin reductase family protein, partial [Acidimicrobiia bacterium]
MSDEGSPNLAPFSFCTAVAWRPPTVLFSTETVSKRKDTLVNAETTREFTLNIVTEDIAEAMVLTSGSYDAAL